jgi:magnesium transporter
MPVKEKFVADFIKWIDVTKPTGEEMEELSSSYNLNQQLVRDCLQPEHLPKYEYDEEGRVHFLILRFYVHQSGKNVSSIQELTNKIALFYNKEILITIHVADTPFLDLIARRAVHNCQSATALLSKIIWEALETFEEPANRLSEQLDIYESQVMLKKTSSDITEALFYIKRQASISHKVLMLMLEPINHIRVKPGEESLIQDVRDQHLKIQTLYVQALEDVNNLLNVSMSFSSQRTNEVMRILTLFSVFFMPLTFIVGIYGMNFEFMPELKQKWGYPGVLLLMLFVAATIYFWFKKKKWL